MGRSIDPVALWQEYVTFPNNMRVGEQDEFLPKVVCPNPAHSTTKSHFQINARQPTVHCFARCGISGTYEHAIAIVNGWLKEDGSADLKKSRKEILRHTRVGVGVEPSMKSRVSEGATKEREEDDYVEDDYRRLQSGDFAWLGPEARAYLDKRGISQASRGKWQLGYDQVDNRLILPAFDEDNRFKFLIKRAIGDGWPKYLYTKGGIKTSILFGACYLDKEMVKSHGLVLVEGSVDTVVQHQHGNRNTAGILGTGLSMKQIRVIMKLSPKKVYLMFDRDEAGVENVVSAWKGLPKIPLFVCRYPGEKADPAEMTKEESERSIARAIPVAEFFRKTNLSPRRYEKSKGGRHGIQSTSLNV